MKGGEEAGEGWKMQHILILDIITMKQRQSTPEPQAQIPVKTDKSLQTFKLRHEKGINK